MSYRKLPTFRRLPVFSLSALALLFPGPCPAVPGDVENRWAPVQITGEITTAAYHPEDGLWVGGNAEIIKAPAHKHLLRLVPNGFKDSTAIPAMGNPVSAIQMLPDRRLLFASSTSSKVQQSSGTANNGFDTAFAAASPAFVNTIGITPERDFLLGRAVAPWLMKISASGAVDAAYASSLTAPVLSLAVLPDGACLAGGGLPAGSGFLTKVSATGVTDPSFAPVFDGAVLAIVIQPDGKILAGGRFLTVNSTPCTGLVRLLPDGSVDPSFNASLSGPPGTLEVKSLLPQVDGALLVSGTFISVDGTPRPGMARLTATGALDPAFSHLDTARYGNNIQLLTLMPDGRVVADVPGAPGKRQIILLENGPGSSNLALTQPDEITWTRSGALPELSQVWFETLQADASGTVPPAGIPLGMGIRTPGGWKFTAPNLPAQGVIRAVGIGPSACGQSSGSLVFDTLSLGTNPAKMQLRRMDAPIAASSPTSLNFGIVWRGSTAVIPVGLRNNGMSSLTGLRFTLTGPNATMFSVIRAPDRISTAGETFSFAIGFNSTAAGNASATLTITSETASVSALTVSLSGTSTLARNVQFDDAFTPVNECNGFNLSGISLGALTFGTAVPYPLNQDLILISNVSGAPITGTLSGWPNRSVKLFSVNSRTRPFIIDYNGGDGNDLVLRPFYTVNADPGFTSPFPQGTQVYGSIRQRNGGWLVAGTLGSVVPALNPNQIPNPGLVRLLADGSLDESFRPTIPAGSFISVSETESGKILVVNSSSGAISRLHPDGSTDPTFSCVVNDWADSIVPLPGGRVLITGSFSFVNGIARRRIAMLNADGSLDPAFAPDPDFTVRCSLLMPDGSFYIGGFFTQINGAARNGLARLGADGALLPVGLEPQNLNTVHSLAQQQTGHILYGLTTGVGRFHESGNIGPVFATGVLPSETFRSVIPQADGKVIVGRVFSRTENATFLTLSLGAGRLNADGSIDATFDAFLSGAPGSLFPMEVTGLHLSNDGTMVFGGDFRGAMNQSAAGFFRARLEPPTETLTIPSPSRIQWLRGGTLPDTTDISFAVHQPATNTWMPLGRGTAIPGGWELTGLTLPANGAIRATARNRGGRTNSSHGFADTILSFGAVTPDCSLHSADGTALPHGASVVDLQAATMGLVKSRTLNLENSGSGPLQILSATLTGPDAAAFSFPLFGVTSLAAGQASLHPVRFRPTEARVYTAQLTISTNDPDTPAYAVTLTGLGASSVEVWRQENFNTLADEGSAANQADPDADGLTNLAEYALSFDPLLSDARRLPSISSPTGFLELRVGVPIARPDIQYSAETSPDPQAAVWDPVPNTGTPTSLIFRIPRTQARQFLRLRFTLQ